jgi:hypothetical protein
MHTGFKIGHDQQSVTEVGELIRYIIDAPTGECITMTYYYEADNISGSDATAWDDCYINATSEANALAQLNGRGINVTHIEQVQD